MSHIVSSEARARMAPADQIDVRPSKAADALGQLSSSDVDSQLQEDPTKRLARITFHKLLQQERVPPLQC